MSKIERDKNGRFVAGHSGGPGRPNKVNELGDLAFSYTLDEEEPQSECEVRERFRIINEAFGLFDVLISQEPFPDMVLRSPRNGRIVRAEVETRSQHFVMHRHDPAGCDLIICWTHNWQEAPISVWPIAHLWYAYKQIGQLGMFDLDHVKEILSAPG